MTFFLSLLNLIRKYLLSLFAFTLLALLYTGCARVQSPQGGKKDTVPPGLISTNPKNGSTNFKGKTIILEFDEPIQLDNLFRQLLVTPFFRPKFTTKIKKNVLIVNFENNFEENSTYTLNFRDAVKDVTEKNTARNVKVSFSTGPEIDTLVIDGRVTDLLEDKPVEDVVVMLFKSTDTVNISNPTYLTKTDKQGQYQLDNVKAGQYQIVALKEEDNDYKFNKKDEKVDFIPGLITLDSNIYDLNFKLYAHEFEQLKAPRLNQNGQYVELEYNKEIIDFSIDTLYVPKNEKLTFFPDATLLRIYQDFTKERIDEQVQANLSSRPGSTANRRKADENEEVLTIADSVYTVVTVQSPSLETRKDTLRFIFRNQRFIKPGSIGMKVEPQESYRLNPGETFDITLKLDKPIRSFDPNKIFYLSDRDTLLAKIDSAALKKGIDTVVYVKSKVTDTLKLENKIESIPHISKFIIKDYIQDPRKRLHISEGAFVSFEYDSLKNKSLRYQYKKEEEYASIEGNVVTEQENFIIQLLESDFKIEAEIVNEKNFRFDLIKPGTKYLRVVIDENKNGKWDPGSFLKQERPENMIFRAKGKLDIKPNWEILNEVLSTTENKLPTN
jgi:uncharacterized protein (DUF2141 family)